MTSPEFVFYTAIVFMAGFFTCWLVLHYFYDFEDPVE